MLQIVPNYNEMFYRCFTTKQRRVKHLWIFGLETRKI